MAINTIMHFHKTLPHLLLVPKIFLLVTSCPYKRDRRFYSFNFCPSMILYHKYSCALWHFAKLKELINPHCPPPPLSPSLSLSSLSHLSRPFSFYSHPTLSYFSINISLSNHSNSRHLLVSADDLFRLSAFINTS